MEYVFVRYTGCSREKLLITCVVSRFTFYETLPYISPNVGP